MQEQEEQEDLEQVQLSPNSSVTNHIHPFTDITSAICSIPGARAAAATILASADDAAAAAAAPCYAVAVSLLATTATTTMAPATAMAMAPAYGTAALATAAMGLPRVCFYMMGEWLAAAFRRWLGGLSSGE